MRNRREASGRLGRRAVWTAAAALALVLWGGVAAADHSLGRSCLFCHSLRSVSVQAGTRNILKDLVVGTVGQPVKFYTENWYCASAFDATGGQPDALDCSYCHNGDVAKYIFDAGINTKGSSHPVDVRGTESETSASFFGTTNRILCNDCHGPDVSPVNPCDKSAGAGGYPNHKNVTIAATVGVGVKQRPGHLPSPYTYDVNSGWLDGSAGSLDDMLCFKCHNETKQASTSVGTTVTTVDVKTDYLRPGGGHNVPNVGTLVSLKDRAGATVTGNAPKLPCYDCHDPHSATSVGTGSSDNDALILNDYLQPNGSTNYQQTTNFTTVVDYNQPGNLGNDRVVCYACHKGTYRVETFAAGAMPDVLAAGWVPRFPFHASAHVGLAASGNCLQKNNGCHQGPHNTDIFRCLDCHSSAASGTNARLLPVRHVGSEFGHITLVSGKPVNGTHGNFIQSDHTIPYDDTKDMQQAANNGCLYCHDTRGAAAGSILKDADNVVYAGLDPATTSDREDLDFYNRFCLSCHDGSGPVFDWGAAYVLSDGGTGNIDFPAGEFYPPQVNNPSSTSSWDSGYYFSSGHGRGTSGTTTAKYVPSNNTAAKIPCLECHLYHGSTAFKLLPGTRQTEDGQGHVMKGVTYSPVTIGSKLSIGGVSDSSKIDYIDYTNRTNNTRLTQDYFLSRYVSDYTNTTYWSTYENGTTVGAIPAGTATDFGTSGDMSRGNTNSVAEGATATTASKIGFCNTCHFYENSTDGTVETAGLAYTHEGEIGAVDGDDQPLKSTATFFKDCCECHDPHGSGRGSAGDTTDENIYMIRKRIRHALKTATGSMGTSDWSAVVFKSLTGADSFDEDDVDNKDDLCAVCHQSASENGNTNVDHNYRSWTGTPTTGKHQEGSNCLTCHPHGEK